MYEFDKFEFLIGFEFFFLLICKLMIIGFKLKKFYKIICMVDLSLGSCLFLYLWDE